MTIQTVFSVCGMCPVRCPIEVEVENGRCRFVYGNRRIPGIRRALCTRGAAGIPFVRDSERPQFPMLRVGARGEGKWRRLSWEEALETASGRLDAIRSKNGVNSLLWMDSGGPFDGLRRALVRGFGSPNYFTSDSIYGVNRCHAALSVFGFPDDRLAVDLKRSRHVVLQARNLFESVDIAQANELLDSLEAGCRLTVIDVRSTVTSGKADRFFRIRPGTDLALNLAVIHVLLKEKRVDRSFSDVWVHDKEGLWNLVEHCTPESAEKETGIPAESIRSLARDLAAAAPHVVWHPGCNSARYRDSWRLHGSIYLIHALLGAVGAAGGIVPVRRPEDVGGKGLKSLTERVPPVADLRVDLAAGDPAAQTGGPGLVVEAFRAVSTGKPYPVRACVTFQTDPLSELPDPDTLSGWMDRLDFWCSITDSWSQAAWYSDLILPLSPYLERESIVGQVDGVVPRLLVRNRCVDPRFDTRSDWEISLGLAGRLGMEGLSFDGIDEIRSYQLEGTGVRISDFDISGVVEFGRERPPAGLAPDFRFPTRSGKIEAGALFIQTGGQTGTVSRPRLAAGSFRLTIGGCGVHHGGATGNNPLLHPQMPENVLWINREAAASIGIANGERVLVSAGNFSGPIRARLTEFIHPEAVFLVPGFGRTIPVESRAAGRGLAANRLMPGGLDLRDPEGGGPALQEQVVTVSRLE